MQAPHAQVHGHGQLHPLEPHHDMVTFPLQLSRHVDEGPAATAATAGAGCCGQPAAGQSWQPVALERLHEHVGFVSGQELARSSQQLGVDPQRQKGNMHHASLHLS